MRLSRRMRAGGLRGKAAKAAGEGSPRGAQAPAARGQEAQRRAGQEARRGTEGRREARAAVCAACGSSSPNNREERTEGALSPRAAGFQLGQLAVDPISDQLAPTVSRPAVCAQPRGRLPRSGLALPLDGHQLGEQFSSPADQRRALPGGAVAAPAGAEHRPPPATRNRMHSAATTCGRCDRGRGSRRLSRPRIPAGRDRRARCRR